MATKPPDYKNFDGQMGNNAWGLFLSPQVTDTQLLDKQQTLNQQSALDYQKAGHPVATSQNMYVIVSRDFLKPATLDPSYGIVNDTVADVYRNIASMPPIFDH